MTLSVEVTERMRGSGEELSSEGPDASTAAEDGRRGGGQQEPGGLAGPATVGPAEPLLSRSVDSSPDPES